MRAAVKQLALPAGKHTSFAARRLNALARATQARNLDPDGAPLLRRFLPGPLLTHAARKTGIADYNAYHAAAEATVELARRRYPSTVCHIHDGDRAFFHAGVVTGGPLVASFHLAPWELEGIQALRRHWQKLARIICCQPRQAMFFQNFVNPKTIVLLPQPVDCARFNPDSSHARDPRHVVIPVSRHLDDALATQVVEAAFSLWPDLQITALELERSFPLKHPAIRSIATPDPSQRRQAYTRAALCLYPVRESVGCAPLLEAASCECPLLLPEVGDIGQVFSHEMARRVELPSSLAARTSELTGALEDMLAAPDETATRAKAARAHMRAEHDVTRVATRLEAIFAGLVS